jgi:hypothetical protein
MIGQGGLAIARGPWWGGVGPKIGDLAVGKGPAHESYKYVGPYLSCLPLGYSHSRNGRKESSMRLLFIYLIVAVELVVATASSAQTVKLRRKECSARFGYDGAASHENCWFCT